MKQMETKEEKSIGAFSTFLKAGRGAGGIRSFIGGARVQKETK